MDYGYKTIGKTAFAAMLFAIIFSGCLPWGQKEQPEEVVIVEEVQQEPTENPQAGEMPAEPSGIEAGSAATEPNELLEVTSAQALQQAIAAKGKVVVDFYAQWCGPCKAMHPIINDLAKNGSEGILFVTADIDRVETKDLMLGDKLVDVRSIPTFYLFKDGKFVTALYGGMNKAMFVEKLNRHF